MQVNRRPMLVEALHDRLFGVASHGDPALALKEISDGGGIHELVHELLREQPAREKVTEVGAFRQGYREARYFFDPSVDIRESTPEEDDAARAFSRTKEPSRG